jgi:hypothetical protein
MKSTFVGVFMVLIMAALLPIVPQMVEFRIRVLHWIGWKSMAELHQNAFDRIVVVVRVVLVLLTFVFVAKLVAS